MDRLGLEDLYKCKNKYGTLEEYNFKRKNKSKADIADVCYKYGVFSLFRYATKYDVSLMVVGTIFSVVHGCGFPVLALVFGRMTNIFMYLETKTNITGNVVTVVTSQLSDETFDNRSFINNTQDGSTKNDENLLYVGYYSLYYLYIGIVVFFSSFLQMLCWERGCERQIHRLRLELFSHILRQDISWFDTRQQTNLFYLLFNHVDRIREGIGGKLSMVVQFVSTFLCGLLVGVSVNWRLTSTLLLLAPVIVGASAYIAKVAASSATREQLKYGEAGAVAEEVLTNLSTVSAFGREYHEVLRYERGLESGRQLAMRKYITLAWGLPLVFFIIYAQYGLAFYYGAKLLDYGYSTPGDVFTVFFSVLSGAFFLGNAMPHVSCVASSVASAAAVFTVVDRRPQIDSYSDTGTRPSELRGHVQFRDVYFSYPSRPQLQVLRGLTLDIKPGQTVAIVGPSGSGKTTIINLLLRFYENTLGSISIDGVPLRQLNVEWLRSQIGVVSQEPVVFNTTIGENIRYGRPSATQNDIELAATMANAHCFIIDLPQGYETVVGERGTRLSGGQKQRIAIARAFVREPQILLLDEATSAMDSENENIVHETLQYAMLGRTTIIVAHRLSTIRNAHLIYTLDRGRVVEQGNHEELMALKGLYYQLVSAQAALTENPGYLSDSMELGTTLMVPRRKFESEISLFELEKKASPEDEGPNVSLWTLVKMNRSERPWLILGVVGCALGGAVTPVFAFFYSELFTTLSLRDEELRSAAVFWSTMFLLLAVLAAFSIWLEIVMMTLSVELLIKRVRLMAFSSIVRQPLSWFDLNKHSRSQLLGQLARDAPFIKGAAALRLGQMLSSTVTVILALAISIVFGWKLTVLLLLLVPLLAAGAYQQTVALRRTRQPDNGQSGTAGKVASECVQNVKTVQALGMETFFMRVYTEALELPFRESKRQAMIYSVIFACSQAVVYVMYAAAFRLGIHLIQSGDITPAHVYRVFFVLVFCATRVGSSTGYVQDYTKAKIAAKQLFRIIDRRSEIDALSQSGLKPVIEGLVTFEDVYFSYPARSSVRILRGLTLKVIPGQTLAIVGVSGCGKSTILALLERFYQPTSGSVKVDGIDIEEINVHHLRRHIGLVTKDPALFNRTIRENIAYGLTEEESAASVLSKVIKAATVANCHDFVSNLPQGYDTRVGEGGCQLSAGQKQRIAIARAVVRDPTILLLDEATSSLDSDSETLVQQALDRVRKGRTCIIVAHRLSTIQNADEIAVLDNGKIRETGSHEELLNLRGLYYQLVKAQMASSKDDIT